MRCSTRVFVFLNPVSSRFQSFPESSIRHPESRVFRKLCRARLVQDFAAQQVKAGATKHLALDELDTVDLSLGLTIAPGQGHSGADGGQVIAQTGGKGADGGKRADPRLVEPDIEQRQRTNMKQMAESLSEVIQMGDERILAEVCEKTPAFVVKAFRGQHQQPRKTVAGRKRGVVGDRQVGVDCNRVFTCQQTFCLQPAVERRTSLALVAPRQQLGKQGSGGGIALNVAHFQIVEMGFEQTVWCASRGSFGKGFRLIVRPHWSIENQLHWSLDVTFCEDRNQTHVGYAPENLALFRRLALILLKRETSVKIGLQAKRLRAGWKNNYLLKVLSG